MNWCESRRGSGSTVCEAERSPWPPPGCWLWPEPASRPRRRRRAPVVRSAPGATTCPAGSSLQVPNGGSEQPGAVRDHLDGHPGRRRQARVAHHLGEQVLRRDLHRAEPEQLSLADAAPAGCAPDELLRHRPLQHGQLHLAGVRPVAVLRRAGRLLDHRQHDEQQQRDHHQRHGRDGTDTDGTTDGSGTNTTPPNATASDNGNYGQLLVHGGVDASARPTTVASTRRTCRPCSTS